MNAYLPGLAKLAPEVVVIQEEVHDVEDGIVIRSAPDHQDEDEGRDSQEHLLPPVLRTKTLTV